MNEQETMRRREPKGDIQYHNTWLLLQKYRNVVWSVEVSVSQSKRLFQKEYGLTVDEYLDSIYSAGVDFENVYLENRAKEIKLSNDMLKLLDSAIELMRTKHYKGEEYYWILYYTYLSPQLNGSVDNIVELLYSHIRDISRRTYYRKRREAIGVLSGLLWGYLDRETIEMMKSFAVEE